MRTINLSGAPRALSSVSKVAGIFVINENYSGSDSGSAQIGLYPELVVGFDMKRRETVIYNNDKGILAYYCSKGRPVLALVPALNLT